MPRTVVDVTFKGEASRALSERIDCIAAIVGRGVTHLHVVAGDSSALYGILHQIDALGLELIGVREIDEGSPRLG